MAESISHAIFHRSLIVDYLILGEAEVHMEVGDNVQVHSLIPLARRESVALIFNCL